MRTSTRQADRQADAGPITEEAFVCALGVGRLLLAGDLPLELELPDLRTPERTAAAPAAEQRAAGERRTARPAPGRGRSRWVRALERYFAGERVAFDLDVASYAAAHGLTDFEREVYEALAKVPYGSVASYRDLAVAAGHPNAYRAAGTVMARNLLPVILPCHRVIKNDGRLGHYGDDPAWKRRLLELEGVRVHEGRIA